MRSLAQQVQADFENYKKQQLRRQTEHLERATEGLVEQLLPVLDSFELALGALVDADDNVRKGVELVYAELLGVLEKAGRRAHRRRRASRSTRTSTKRCSRRTATASPSSPTSCAPDTGSRVACCDRRW